MRKWLLLPEISAPMPFQMAFDEILFRRAESTVSDTVSDTPVLRFFYASEPWVTVGYSYVNGRLRDFRDKKICRRITGGGVIVHGKDLIFSVIARKDDDDSFTSVRQSYLKIHEAVKQGFERLGHKPRFYRCDESLPKGDDCFRFPIATDLALGKKKIAGGAQKRSSRVMLHQESVKIPKGTGAEALMVAIKIGFEEIFNMEFVPGYLTPEFLEETEQLSRKKYERT